MRESHSVPKRKFKTVRLQDCARSQQTDIITTGANAGFLTDTDISGSAAPRERELQRWTSSAETDLDLSLEQSVSGSGEAWDQFKANEKLFGLKTDYNEEIYTTAIDRSNPSYRELEAKAQQLAREIEKSAAKDAHTREERGVVGDDEPLDEEAK